jgi:hypothetical protein
MTYDLKALSAKSQRLYEESAPTGPGIAVGSTGERKAQEAEALAELVRGIRRGLAPPEAASAAKVAIRKVIVRHNARRRDDVHWKVWEGAYDAVIDYEANHLVLA